MGSLNKKPMLALLPFIVAVILLAGCASQKPEVAAEPPSVQPPQPQPSTQSSLKSFSSYDEIYSFLETSNPEAYRSAFNIFGFAPGLAGPRSLALKESADSGSPDYSATNIQVEGVDEPDIVKTDGKYIYVVKEQDDAYLQGPFGYYPKSKIKVIEAYPPSQMKQVSEITIDGTASEIFIHGNMLVVFGNIHVPFYSPQPLRAEVRCSRCILPPRYSDNFAFMRVYDLSDKSAPKLVKRIEVKGSYQDARLINGKVFAVYSDYPSYVYPVPIYRVDGNEKEILPSEISYFDYPDSGYGYSILSEVDLADLKSEGARRIFLLGQSQTLFVSANNLYIASISYDYYDPTWRIYNEVFEPYFDEETKRKIEEIDALNISPWRKERMKADQAVRFIQSKLYNPLDLSANYELREELMAKLIQKQNQISEGYRTIENTEVHKFALDGKFTYKGKGAFPGRVLNQFSMDEHEGNFRIATTKGNLWDSRQKPENNIYIADSEMRLIGKLEGLAPDETIYSARFMGDRAYLVTFRQIDPLFVIDLSSPSSPKVLGKLKIPGYSNYLHPYGEGYLIGIGKEVIEYKKFGQDIALQQGVKLSLFDVRNVEEPKEVAKFVIGDRGTESPALYDHKAFLFSKEKNLLSIPILLAKVNPLSGDIFNPEAYGDYVFQGAYVFSVSPDEGFRLLGAVSHAKSTGFSEKHGYFLDYGRNVKRSLYIGDYLYTISDAYVKSSYIGEFQNQTAPPSAVLPYELPEVSQVAIGKAQEALSLQ